MNGGRGEGWVVGWKREESGRKAESEGMECIPEGPGSTGGASGV